MSYEYKDGDTVIRGSRLALKLTESDNAAHLVTLPDPVPGLTLTIKNCGTAFELQSSDPETVAINGGTAEGASSTVAANRTLVARCVSETAWIVSQYTEDATESKLDAASA